MQSELLSLKNRFDETAEILSSYVKKTPGNTNLLEKCNAFTSENRSTTFEGNPGQSSRKHFFLLDKLKTLLQKKSLIGVGCPEHVFNDCIRTAVEILERDVKNVIYKTYQPFRFYTLHIEALKTLFAYILILYIPCIMFILHERWCIK